MNAAAIHYHFGAKRLLLEAVLRRRILPRDQARLKQLEQLEAAVPTRPLPSRALIEAFLAPIASPHAADRESVPTLGRLMAWLFIEGDGGSARNHFSAVAGRFAEAACEGRDDLEPAEAAERLEYAAGAAARIAHAPTVDDPAIIEDHLHRLIGFLAGGFDTPGKKKGSR